MCMGSRPKPAPPPAPAPPPPEDPPVAPVVNETAASDRNLVAARRRGRRSLRIDLAGATTNNSGTGLNIPV